MTEKKKFGKKEVKAMKEVLSFLWKEARVAENQMDATGKHKFESMAMKLSKVLYKE